MAACRSVYTTHHEVHTKPSWTSCNDVNINGVSDWGWFHTAVTVEGEYLSGSTWIDAASPEMIFRKGESYSQQVLIGSLIPGTNYRIHASNGVEIHLRD